MPKIFLRFKDIKIREYPAGQTLTIGRKYSNDIVIYNLAVSGNHMRIKPVATTFVLRDLDSTNGTFINEKKVTIDYLQHDDVILIGIHALVYDYFDRIKTVSSVHDNYDVDKTRIINTSAYHDLISKFPAVAPQADPLPRSDAHKEQEFDYHFSLAR